MKGQRVAVAGMGRSGIAIAHAAAKNEAYVCVYDEKSADTPERIADVEKLEAAGIEVVTGWHGRLNSETLDILVASPGFRRDHPAIRDALGTKCEVISEVEFAYRIAKAPILAITGTNGKSTTTVMAWMCAKTFCSGALLCGNISGSGYPELTLTEAATIAKEDDILVAEISSYQLEWVRDFKPKAATITNITPDHFDRHPHFVDYYDTKMRIFAAQDETDFAIVNRNEPSLPFDRLSEAVSRAQIKPFPEDGIVSVDESHIHFYGASLAKSEFQVIGEHNFVNSMQALRLSECFCPNPPQHAEAMLQALTKVAPLQHRMEKVGFKNGVTIVNNSMCTNPSAVVASAYAIRQPLILLMGGEMKGLDFAEAGEALRELGCRVVLFSEFRRDLGASLKMDCPGFESMQEAFDFAVSEAKTGDCVMLAPGCASAFPYPNFRDRGDDFREFARRWESA